MGKQKQEIEESEKQRLREEGFNDCKSYMIAFSHLKNMKKLIDNNYSKRNNEELDILELVVGNATGCLENSMEVIEQIENKYRMYLNKSYNRSFSKKEYEELLKDFAKSHKKLAEHVAYSKLEKELVVQV